MRHFYINGRIHRDKMRGQGMGSVLLNKGGAGSGSSYESIDDYKNTVGSGLGDKLNKLVVRPLTKKPKNIHFG